MIMVAVVVMVVVVVINNIQCFQYSLSFLSLIEWRYFSSLFFLLFDNEADFIPTTMKMMMIFIHSFMVVVVVVAFVIVDLYAMREMLLLLLLLLWLDTRKGVMYVYAWDIYESRTNTTTTTTKPLSSRDSHQCLDTEKKLLLPISNTKKKKKNCLPG